MTSELSYGGFGRELEGVCECDSILEKMEGLVFEHPSKPMECVVDVVTGGVLKLILRHYVRSAYDLVQQNEINSSYVGDD
jgi:hypothetical protein